MTYKLGTFGVVRLEDGATIPPDISNKDWQIYQMWVSDGNTPLAKDPPPPATQDEIDATTAKSYAKLNSLKSMSPAQVQAWVDANINTLADAKDALKTLAIAASILARRI